MHNLSKEEVLNKLNSSVDGLSNKEAIERIKKDGRNILPTKKSDTIFTILLRQFVNPIVFILLITVVFCFLIDELTDAIVILFIILVDVVMGTIQEFRANKTAESLKELVSVSSKVLRDGKEVVIDSSLLCKGDIVLLNSGDKIVADGRIIECYNLQVDESTLTGESENEVKTSDIIDKDTDLADRQNMVYSGTMVITGRAKYVVTSTGRDTEIGMIAHEVTTKKDEKSPLTIRMEKFSSQISIIIVIVAILLTFLLYLKGQSGSEIFLAVVALSVSAMPEGLPLALTMALVIASNKMSKKNVVVKKLNSVESLGSCTVIATDKTGTLTVNEQTAKKIVLNSGVSYDITGSGYNDEGMIKGPKESGKEVLELIRLGTINNEASLVKENDEFKYYGDSIDIAFLSLSLKAKTNINNYSVIDKIPYESENKYSAVFYKKDGISRCTVKGSYEVVKGFCTNDTMSDYNDKLAEEGYRVIAIADGEVNNKEIKDLEIKGLVCFIDPIREDVKDSLEECRKAGIKVAMITGDHPLTALAIAKDLGLASSIEEVTTGKEINKAYEEGSLDELIKNKKIFTRVTPLDKLHIVQAYKKQGEFVAVTGDGVNDAPALKSANIGVAMGSGSDVAKETASMIIMDDSFKSIVNGVREGRSAYSNIRKVCYMLLSSGVAEVSFFALSVLLNFPMPLVAIQLLWLNIVTDGLQDFALSFEKTEEGIMDEKPRSPKESIFDKKLLEEVMLSGLLTGLIVFVVWVYLIKVLYMPITMARGYIMVLMVFMQNIHVLNCRSEKQSVFKIPLKNNPLVIFSIVLAIVLQVLVMEVPILSSLLEVETISITSIIVMFMISLIVLVVMEVYKFICRKC